jgi:hypothetical protein
MEGPGVMSREAVFNEWLAHCRAVGFAHGQELYAKLLDYAQGKFFLDSADADALLRKAEEAGIIYRVGKPQPTFSQRVAGIGGGAYSDKLTYPHLFGWEPAFTVKVETVDEVKREAVVTIALRSTRREIP